MLKKLATAVSILTLGLLTGCISMGNNQQSPINPERYSSHYQSHLGTSTNKVDDNAYSIPLYTTNVDSVQFIFNLAVSKNLL